MASKKFEKIGATNFLLIFRKLNFVNVVSFQPLMLASCLDTISYIIISWFIFYDSSEQQTKMQNVLKYAGVLRINYFAYERDFSSAWNIIRSSWFLSKASKVNEGKKHFSSQKNTVKSKMFYSLDPNVFDSRNLSHFIKFLRIFRWRGLWFLWYSKILNFLRPKIALIWNYKIIQTLSDSYRRINFWSGFNLFLERMLFRIFQSDLSSEGMR